MSSVNGTAYENKLREMTDHKASKKARQLDRAAKIVIWGATDLVALTALILGAWSNQTVAHWLGVPGKAGWGAALVIDGIWLVSLAIVQLHRKEPWRALAAYQATVLMVVLSVITNFAHGLIRFEATWRGMAAGLLFAFLPVSLKWLISVSTKNSMGLLLKAPDARNRIKQAGQISAELELNQLLEPVVQRVNHEASPVQAIEPAVTRAEEPQVRLERFDPEEDANWVPEWVNSSEPVVLPELEPVKGPEIPVVQPLTNLNDRQTRIDDLAKKIGERGGQLSSVTFKDLETWYGVTAKSSASNLRKAAHKRWLEMAPTGQYL